MIKIDKQNIINSICEKIEHFYKDNGFTLIQKGATRFERNDLIVTWSPFSEYIDSIVFMPNFIVKNVNVLKIIKLIFPEVIGIELTIVRVQSLELTEEMAFEDYESKFIYKDINGSVYSYRIEKDTPLEQIVEDHINFMTKVGLPFFEKVDSLEGINDFLNGRILKGDMDYFCSEERVKELQPFFSQREVLSGVTCAYLIKNPKIEELLNRYQIFFEGNNYVLEPMEKVVEYFNQKIN
jgi:hypothetical protein